MSCHNSSSNTTNNSIYVYHALYLLIFMFQISDIMLYRPTLDSFFFLAFLLPTAGLINVF